MPTDFKLKAGTPQTLSSSQAAISNGAAAAAATNLDNTTALATSYSFALTAGFGSSVSAGSAIDLYLVPLLDGTNAGAVDAATPYFQPSHLAGTFVTPTTGTTARILNIEGVSVGPYKYTAYLFNRSNQQISSAWTLVGYPELAQGV